MIKLIIN